MADIVLVHGRFLGGWCWRRVTSRLRASGHEVYSPTLTGSGDRQHQMNPRVGLEDHVQDLAQLIEFENLNDVLLVGHGFGGLVISGLADRLPDRLRHLVYLDGWVGQNGQSYLDLVGDQEAQRLRQIVSDHGEGWFLPPPSADSFQLTTNEDLDWLGSRLTRHSLRSMEEALRLSGPRSVPALFVECGSPNYESPAELRQAAVAGKCRTVKLLSGHYPMFTTPKKLADLLQAMPFEAVSS
jgi:pimeloyl-ACP methyl ester carboxylesterase